MVPFRRVLKCIKSPVQRIWKLLLICVILICVFKIPLLLVSIRRLNLELIQNTKVVHCLRPKLIVDLKHRRAPGPLRCGEKAWVYVKNGSLYYRQDILKKHGNITCTHSSVTRGSDDWKILDTDFVPICNGCKLKSDFFRVNCISPGGFEQNSYHAGIKFDETLQNREGKAEDLKRSLGLNILMFGLDSMSRITWETHLTESHKYLTNSLGGLVLEGYNILGDGTPQALLPILTGHTEEELPEARRSKKGAKTVDGHPWIWKNLKKLGYITQYGEDGAGFGTFHYRMLGFKDQPTDYYLRPFYLKYGKTGQKPYCLGDTPLHLNMLNWIKHVYHMYPRKRKFSFLFHSEYTHSASNQRAQWADEDLKEFLHYMETNNYLNNTLLILMADHGPRYSFNRRTINGKYEERLPYVALRFPSWFKGAYPEAFKNLKVNTQRLTTPFDIYETFMDIVHFTGAGTGDVSSRGISLFKEIPEERTCKDAHIEPHWCACLNWKSANISSSLVKGAVKAFIEKINTFTKEDRKLCAVLSLHQINNAVYYSPNEGILKFKRSRDVDGRIPDLSDTMKAKVILIQITVTVVPSMGMYEATVKYLEDKAEYTVSEKEISRINRYGDQPSCVADKKPHLRAYCYCI